MNYDATYAGYIYENYGNAILYRYSDGYLKGVAVSAVVDNTVYQQGDRVTLTGYTVTSKMGKTGYQCTNGRYILMEDGWTRDGYTKLPTHSTNQAQKLIDKIISCNQKILCGNLLCARYANKLTQDQQQQVRDLQRRLEIRNNTLQDDGLVQVTESSYPAGYADLAPYLEKLMAGETIGLATIAWIIIGCIVLAGMGTAAYYGYKYFADEAEKDLQYSEELTNILRSKLTDEEYQQLMDETKGILTKKYIAKTFAGLGDGMKKALIIGAGILGTTIILRALLRR